MMSYNQGDGSQAQPLQTPRGPAWSPNQGATPTTPPSNYQAPNNGWNQPLTSPPAQQPGQSQQLANGMFGAFNNLTGLANTWGNALLPGGLPGTASWYQQHPGAMPTQQQGPFQGWNGVGLPPGSSVDPPGVGPTQGGGEDLGHVSPAPFPSQGLGTGNTQQPQDLQSMISQMLGQFGGGGTANPFQPFYQPYPTQGQATTFQGAQMNSPYFANAAQSHSQTDLNPQFMQQLGPQSTIQQILTGFAPQANRAQNALNDQLAASGIQGGAAANATGELQQQLAAGLAPSLAGAIQNSNQQQLQGNEFGLGNQMQQSMYNAGNRQQSGLANAQFGNNANYEQAGLNQQTGLANMGAMNQMTGQNLQNIMQNQAFNTGAANNAQQMFAQYLQNAYGMDYNTFNNLNMAGLTGQQGLAQTGLYGSNNLAGIGASTFPVQTGAAAGFQNLGNQLGYQFGQQQNGSPYGYSSPVNTPLPQAGLTYNQAPPPQTPLPSGLTGVQPPPGWHP